MTFDANSAKTIAFACREVYLDSFYEDIDGERVMIILNFISPGILSWIERFRDDSKPVLNRLFLLVQLRLVW